MSNLSVPRSFQAVSSVLSADESLRLHRLRGGQPSPGARYVLYWMQINRRAEFNPALDHAILEANRLRLPLVVYEGLRADYPYANARIHTFMLEGAAERHEALKAQGIRSVFFLQSAPGEHRDTVQRLCQEAALLVTDGYPTFIIGHQTQKILERTRLPITAVDASTIVPPQLFPKAEWAARTLRPKLQRVISAWLVPPESCKLTHANPRLPLPIDWETDLHQPVQHLVQSCQIDHSVKPSLTFRGGSTEARKRLQSFLKQRLKEYDEARNDPGIRGTSELSPYLHFGTISPLEVALAAMNAPTPDDSPVSAFLEELIVRRELAFNFCTHHPHFDSLAGLPDWARKSLAEHDGDARSDLWSFESIEQARTPDLVWNLAQRELLLTGKIHGYIRMLWGKKIIEHSPSHAEALRRMIVLHDKYALDGRDPNTYTNILWCMGLHDRAWGPPKPVIGLIRPMSSDAMRRKTDLTAYKRWLDFIEAGARL